MEFDFDKVIDRWNSHSSKWDGMEKAVGAKGRDAIALWVAEMDFESPPAVKEALIEQAERGTHGYYTGDATWREAMSGWLSRRHGWEPDPDWITPTSGIVSALGLILQEFSEENDHIVVFSPAYHAFGKIIAANNRRIHNQPMINEQGRYRMDLEGLAASLPSDAKVMFFCSPHNPGGRVWEEDEIRAVCEFCIEHDLLLVSDEIHHDLVYSGYTHHVTAKLVPEVMDRLVTCAAATKTFNLAGAHIGGAIISNSELRRRFRSVSNAAGLLSFPLFGMIATEAAQRHGDAWLDALLPYLEKNRDLLADRVSRDIPGARAMHIEATYLGWIDFAGTGLDRQEVTRRIAEDARLGVSPGPQFGPGGESWIRLNFATPRSVLNEALDRMADAFSNLRR
ncbi:MalY/PatB family protein [Salaquimonas pukyongi]|uniref:MalY/PatB family protein n=1 Tax=Salaquimonas pukyongi TaxID=2712698 RepID=UPI00096BB8C1|nr:MalY/PatB family protein [Salaquimonas pukyongi]